MVVSPETASKYACVNDMGRPMSCPASISGIAADSGNNIHTNDTSITPWRGCSSCLNSRNRHHSQAPAVNVTAIATGYTRQTPSWVHRDTARGSPMESEKTMIRMPSTRRTGNRSTMVYSRT
ncbi:hypothetical protein D3C71_1606140 [compost metagenome]